MLNPAITSRRLTRMPIRPAVIDARMRGEDLNLPIEADRILLAFEVPPKMLRDRATAGKRIAKAATTMNMRRAKLNSYV